MKKDPEKPYAIIGIIIALTALVYAILGKTNLQTTIILVVLAIAVIILTVLGYNINKIDNNKKRLDKLEENFKINERLIRLEFEMGVKK